ncbi:double-strand break repair protein AddB [Roseobacter sp. YSTF-M11]|uniref:Double-strand break repair protein AddB n=1 Tax=Roseobacter insulae TaxID=2859783 RepID=A0A9X1FSQ7_9RHOB|nr:double-strand break repair protein AddB [Roseobacter insulae]MBW4706699.1 double-strand break repair protein AddB [Roseobacter insulae]
MFDSGSEPRLFGVDPGADFPRALVDGVIARMADRPPEAMARVQLIVNTRRMQRRLRGLFEDGPARLLPKIRLITDLDALDPAVVVPQAVSPLRRRLELIALVSRLLSRERDLAPRSSLFDLTDSLAALMDEMQGEGVTARTIADLDVTDQSGHWQRALQFIQIAQEYMDGSGTLPDAEARQRLLISALAEKWRVSPPADPVIIAGSTGSRGTTMLLMQAVAKLPQGALVLPGFDFEMPAAVWSHLDNAMLAEDHPQYRFQKLMNTLGVGRSTVTRWHQVDVPSRDRNALVSLSLRPAPVTDAWLTEGKTLSNIATATQDITLLEAPGPRDEALAIAMRLRQAAETGETAALITPDRMLTRQVTAALDQWNILPDDSAGTPLHLSPPGRFLRHVSSLFVRRLDAESLLTLLKHPLTHSGTNRGHHVLNTQRLELKIRKHGLPYPDSKGIAQLMQRAVASADDQRAIDDWADHVGQVYTGHMMTDLRPLSDWVADHIAVAEAIAGGLNAEDPGELWQKKAGQKARAVMQNLADQAGFGTDMSAADYSDLVGALLSGEEVRDRDAPHPNIMIWGTLEARVQGADLVILAGLNDGTWPEVPAPDPWLNRALRHQAALLLPERRIGLSAHDYQQAIGAKEVWLTRAIRSDDAETVASRWINRLCNLLAGLQEQGGRVALDGMRARGETWLRLASAFEATDRIQPAHRPSPRPPVAARPPALSVTEIKRLIRDPYAIYARHVLRLAKLGPLVQSPDALMRGTLAHEIMERFVKETVADPHLLTAEHLAFVARDMLEQGVPWPAARAMWLARIEKIADWFVAREKERRHFSHPVAFEGQAKGKLAWPDLGFTLTARADRLDRTEAGDVLIYDYKTGKPPSAREQATFDKQLLIEAAMVEQGAFETLGICHVAMAVFIGLGASPSEVPAPLDEEPPQKVLDHLRKLIGAYLSQEQGFTSRRMMQQDKFAGDYDQLARFGEWDATMDPTPEDLT